MVLKKNSTLIFLYGIIALFPIVFFSTTLTLIHTWSNSDTFAHGFLIFPITFWLIWQKKEILEHLKPEPEYRLFILIIPLCLVWIVADIVDVNLVRQVALISLILSTIVLLLGRTVFKAFLVPLLFLFFAVPFGEVFVPPLMDFTAFFTVSMVQLTGIPIYQDGLYFSLPSGNWSVVEACSGVRYLIASFVLGTIYAYISYNSFKKRAIFILASLIVPIIANGFRAFLIVMIGHHSGMTLATGVDHLFFGWAFFGAVIFIVFYIGSRWWDPVLPLDDEIAALKLTRTNTPAKPVSKPIIVLIAVLASSLFLSHWVKDKNTVSLKPSSISLSNSFNEWQFAEGKSLNWHPLIKSADSEHLKSYQFANSIVDLYIAHYQSQNSKKEVISSSNRIDDGEDGKWRIINQGEYQNDTIFVKETQLLNGNRKLLVWNWYRMGALETPNPYIAKSFDAYNQLISHRLDNALIAVATPINGDIEASRATINDFILAAKESINSTLDLAHQQAIE